MKRYNQLISLLIILGSIYGSFYALMPQNYSKENTPPDEFSTERALAHVKVIARQPHYLGAPYHKEVQKYIVEELKKAGIYTEIQEGYSLSSGRALSRPQNIIGRIKGTENGNAVLLLSHYDSSPHSSLGASDAASGVAAILEGIRAFRASAVKPKNDIIILISDAEELDLNGAELFVKKHPWAKEVRVILNFESRGSGGPSYMFIETNGGNAKMVKAFKEADVPFPAANSLAYSIYKMLPNDTDLTVFRKEADINGFNFAFIDDHFDYHTAGDSYENLDKNSLEHQGTYLMPLLRYFAHADLEDVKSLEDNVYFGTPLGLYSYPFMWVFPLLVIAFIAFVVLLALGFGKKRLALVPVLGGFAIFILILFFSTVAAYFGWDLLRNLYPQYDEILHGFPYNGYGYIAAFLVFTLAVCFMGYSFFNTRERVASYAVAPLFIWLLINTGIALYLKGGSFFIIPVYFSLLIFYLLIRYPRPYPIGITLLALPAIFIFIPFFQGFPVGLGLKMLAVSALLTVLVFGLLLPVFGSYPFKRTLAVLLFILFGFFLIKAHFSSHFNDERPKPNSLLYVLNTNENTAQWATYDRLPDDWTKRRLGDTPEKASSLNKNILLSKYGTAFTYMAEAPVKAIPPPKISITGDTLIGDERHIEICITPQRPVNRLEIFAEDVSGITSLSANGEPFNSSGLGKSSKSSKTLLLNHYISATDEYLELRFILSGRKHITLEINEISFDLLQNDAFGISPRSRDMIPKPFVINDAILVKKTIQL